MHSILRNIFARMVDESYSNEERELLEYVFILYSFEIIKAVIIIFLFFILGYIKEALVICSVMFLSKPFIGGYHEDSQLKCLIATFLAILWIVFLGNNSDLTFSGNVLIIILSIFCVWNQAPVIDDKMPITNQKVIERNRIVGTAILTIFGVLSIILSRNSNYYIFITWTILFQALMMFKKKTNIEKN